MKELKEIGVPRECAQVVVKKEKEKKGEGDGRNEGRDRRSDDARETHLLVMSRPMQLFGFFAVLADFCVQSTLSDRHHF